MKLGLSGVAKLTEQAGGLRQFLLAVALLTLTLTAGASSAGAAVTVGQTATPTNTCQSPVDRVQPTVSTGTSYVMPANGAITSWSTITGTNGGQLKMKVYRPVPGSPNTFMVVGNDGPRDLALNTTNTFPANIQVKVGDVLGFNSFSGSPDCGFLVMGDSYLREPAAAATPSTGDLADGQSATFTGVVMDRRLDISAQLEPTNTLTFGAVTRNKKKGTATLTVNVPNPGELTASSKGAKVARAAGGVTSKAVSAGNVRLLIKAKGKKKKKRLNETGKVKLKIAVTYTPTGGGPNTQSRKLKLKKR